LTSAEDREPYTISFDVRNAKTESEGEEESGLTVPNRKVRCHYTATCFDRALDVDNGDGLNSYVRHHALKQGEPPRALKGEVRLSGPNNHIVATLSDYRE